MVKFKENVNKAFGENIHQKLGELLGQRYIDYRAAWNNALPGSTPPFPIHLDFEFYDSCNQRCTFCPRNETIHANLSYPIEWSVLKKIATEGQENNLYSVNFGAYAEPLLYNRLFDAIRLFISSNVVDTRLITNGLLLHKYYNEIFDSELLNLYVSLDAYSKETYEKQRGKGFNTVKDNLWGFLEEKKYRNSTFPIVRVSFVENKNNLHEKAEFIKLWKDKVDFIDLQLMIDYTKQEFEDGFATKWNCIDPFRRLSIISNGDVLPCCSFNGRSLVVGNVYQNSLKQIWLSEKVDSLRQNLLDKKIDICNVCQS